MTTSVAPRGVGTTTAPFLGKVAEILNEREVIINRGAADGVQVGDRFVVLGQGTRPVKDPDSGEVLGEVEVEKARVEAVDVRPRFSVCASCRRTLGWAEHVAELVTLGGPPMIVQVPRLAANEPAIAGDRYVQVGDVVRRLPEPRAG